MVINPVLYAAIMILWLVTLSALQIIPSMLGIVNVMCLVVPANVCVFCVLWKPL